MALEINLLSDLLDALERVGKHVATAARLPKKRRNELLDVLDKTYEVADRVLLMVIGRIGRVIDRAERDAQGDFASELSQLGWSEDWLGSSRELSLSSGLRRVHAEMERAPTRFLSRRAVRDWDELKRIMEQTMDDEGGLAEEIGKRLIELSRHADAARSSDEGFRAAWAELSSAREAFESERRRLITAEAKIYSVV
jgi:hypothetical protein